MKKFLSQKFILILFVAIGSIFILSLFLRNEVSKIQTNLPLSIMEDHRIIDEVTQYYSQMIILTHNFRNAPTKENFDNLKMSVHEIKQKLSVIQKGHHFTSIAGMSYVLAIVSPIVHDFNEWLEMNYATDLDQFDYEQAGIFLTILEDRLERGQHELNEEISRIDAEIIFVLKHESSNLDRLIDLLQIPYLVSFILMIVLVFQFYLRMTDRKYQQELSERISQTEARFLNALEALPEGFALFDNDDNFLFANSAFYTHSKLSKRDLLTHKTFTGFSTEVVRVLSLQTEETEALTKWQSDFLKFHKLADLQEDTYLTIGQQDFRFREYLLNAGYCLLQVSNVTRQKDRERALKHAVGQAEDANRAKSEFLAMMSHELRTPLNAIIGFTDIMRKHLFGPIENDRYNSYLKDIHKSGCHLLDLIEDILDLSKIESGNSSLTVTEFDIKNVVEEVTSILRERAVLDQIELTTTFNIVDSLSLKVSGDERYTKQMLINLISNAIKFTTIKYSTKTIQDDAGEQNREFGRVCVYVNITQDQDLKIDIKDNGVGICEQDLPKVTEAFYQVEHQMNRRHEGSGLGLSLVKSLIELHGGQLIISSEENIGTVCSIIFPNERLHFADKKNELDHKSEG